MDLFPLYMENQCSADTRALMEEYLRQNPDHGRQLQQAMNAPLPTAPTAPLLDETRALRAARRQVRRRSVLLGLAIFFSLCPFSMFYTGGKTYWLLLESPGTALVYTAAAGVCWVTYLVMRYRSKII
jgi:ferric-dicitrate binding protein FerR (iron transport regulator)